MVPFYSFVSALNLFLSLCLNLLLSLSLISNSIPLAATHPLQYSGYMKYPEWLIHTLDFEHSYSPIEFMDLAVEIARLSAENGGGPFGTVIGNDVGTLLEIGWNRVAATYDTTAHGEIVCIRAAQQKLKTFKLESYQGHSLALYSSASPCIQCFGAIYWSGLKKVYSGAPREFPEKLGFMEGPMSESLWAEASKDKGIEYNPEFFSSKEKISLPFEIYKKRGGVIY